MNDIGASTALAVRMASAVDAEGFPSERAWETAPPIRFSADWQGQNADARRETEVRLLWSPDSLYLRFDARYRTITVFADAEPSGRRDQLWDRDVCEVFLQAPHSAPRCYKELEVAPNGRVNFYRVEGEAEPRFYSAWRPTNTPQPNFHVPEAFGALVFTEAASKIRR